MYFLYKQINFVCSEKSCMFLVHSASKSLIQVLICIQSGTKKNSLVLIEIFSCYINNSIEVLLSEILCCILCSLQPFFSCAARRTYSLNSTDLASIKVVPAGKTFLFGLMYFLIALVLVKGRDQLHIMYAIQHHTRQSVGRVCC